ncbi:MAG: hypothetical protein ABI778_00315 [Ignavibacteriota bacterium]
MNLLNKAFVLLFALLCVGCYYDSQDLLYTAAIKAPCDTTFTYSGRISKIIELNCNSCHSAKNAPLLGENVILDDFDNMQIWSLLGKVTGDIKGEPGFNQMPKAGNKLSDCDINAIQKWVDANTPHN